MLGDAFGALFLIATVIFLAPLIARAIPGGFVPETVLLLAGGMAMGAAGFTLTEAGEPISFLRELGVGFLFCWPVMSWTWGSCAAQAGATP